MRQSRAWISVPHDYPTLAILAHDGHKVPMTIPQGALVEVDEPLDGNELVKVLWDGKTVLMFATDIRNRGERVKSAGG